VKFVFYCVCYAIIECDAPRDYVHRNNIFSFAGCTVIKGVLKILNFVK